MFTLNNDGTDIAKFLRVLSGPGSFFRHMRILVAGQLVEDTDQRNRIHEIIYFLLLKKAKRTMPQNPSVFFRMLSRTAKRIPLEA